MERLGTGYYQLALCCGRWHHCGGCAEVKLKWAYGLPGEGHHVVNLRSPQADCLWAIVPRLVFR